MPDAPIQKICSVCGVDCSKMKRFKDPQGRYVCEPCHQAIATKTQPRTHEIVVTHKGRAEKPAKRQGGAG